MKRDTTLDSLVHVPKRGRLIAENNKSYKLFYDIVKAKPKKKISVIMHSFPNKNLLYLKKTRQFKVKSESLTMQHKTHTWSSCQSGQAFYAAASSKSLVTTMKFGHSLLN